MTFIVTIKETTGAEIGTGAEASTAQKAFKAALSIHNEMKDIIRRECPIMLEDRSPKKKRSPSRERALSDPKKARKTTKDLLSDPTSKDPDMKRLDALVKDEDNHFSKHIVKGKIVKLDKNCGFCSVYHDQLSKHYPTTSE